MPVEQNQDDAVVKPVVEEEVVETSTPSPTPKPTEEPEKSVEELAEEIANEKLKDIKEKLNGAFEARDKAEKRAQELEQKEAAERRKRLEEEGRHKELYEEDIQKSEKRIKELEEQNTALTRDVNVRAALGSYEFRNSNASDMAYAEILKSLVKSDTGSWQHFSGVSIEEAVRRFAEDESNAFLFKVKASSGSGSPSDPKTPTTTKKTASVFEMSQDEVLKLAGEGKLKQRQK